VTDLDLESFGYLLHVAHGEGRQPWPVYHLSSDEGAHGFSLELDRGALNVVSTPDDGWRDALLWWSQLVVDGHQSEAAASIVSAEAEHDWLIGRFHLDVTEAPGLARLTYRAVIPLWTLSDAGFLDAVLMEAQRLDEVLTLWDEFVQMRERSDASLIAFEADWPAALTTLADDQTSVSMLGILFQRFEENSVHEHVFFHPNADQALRERVVASWEAAAAQDAPQPYGDPAAPSDSFAPQRAQSLAFLKCDAAR